MSELRKQFEVLPEIRRIVSCDEIKWCNVYNWYRTDNTDSNSIYHVAWLNGAWYAFQEQQKKGQIVLSKIHKFEEQTSSDQSIFMNDLLKEIKELLK